MTSTQSATGGRSEPQWLAELGKATDYLSETEKEAWKAFSEELPWLVCSYRALLESACILRARVREEDLVTASLLRKLRLHVSALGGCPKNRSNIQMPDDELDDEWAQFL